MADQPDNGKDAMARPDSTLLVKIGGWLFVAAMVYAPWAFGSRPYLLCYFLDAQLFVAWTLWALGYLNAKRRPRVPWPVVTLALGLISYSWIAWFNPESVYDPVEDRFVTTTFHVPWLPTTVDAINGLPFTVNISSMLLATMMAADLANYKYWRNIIFTTIAATGTSVVAGGLLLKTGVAPGIVDYLRHRAWADPDIFGPFDYHGNASTFFNLALPAVATCAGRARSSTGRCAWLAATGLFYMALLVNSPRTGLMIGVACMPLIALIAMPTDRPAGGNVPRTASGRPPGSPVRWQIIVGVCLVFIALGGVVVTQGKAKSWDRLNTLREDLSNPYYARFIQYRVGWEISQEHPALGAGVGAYKLLVQHSSIRGMYFAPRFRPGEPFNAVSHTKEDYLQTLAEWGWVGFGVWAALVGGALASLLWSWKQHGFVSVTTLATGTALLGVYIHALVDCPLQIPALQFYTAIYLGFAWGSPRWASRSASLFDRRASTPQHTR